MQKLQQHGNYNKQVCYTVRMNNFYKIKVKYILVIKINNLLSEHLLILLLTKRFSSKQGIKKMLLPEQEIKASKLEKSSKTVTM